MPNKKILAVEDDLMLVELMRHRLESSGYEVITAENGKEGSFKAMAERPDIVLADIMMPELDGLEMIKIIRANSDLKDVPIIVCSALGREDDIKKAMDAGANDYVVKPYDSTELINKIEKYTK